MSKKQFGDRFYLDDVSGIRFGGRQKKMESDGYEDEWTLEEADEGGDWSAAKTKTGKTKWVHSDGRVRYQEKRPGEKRPGAKEKPAGRKAAKPTPEAVRADVESWLNYVDEVDAQKIADHVATMSIGDMRQLAKEMKLGAKDRAKAPLAKKMADEAIARAKAKKVEPKKKQPSKPPIHITPDDVNPVLGVGGERETVSARDVANLDRATDRSEKLSDREKRIEAHAARIAAEEKAKKKKGVK